MSTPERRRTSYAVSVPQLLVGGRFDPAPVSEYLARAEELGFDGAWVTEQVVGTAPSMDPTVLLAFAATATARIRLGCAVYVSSVASPLHLATAIASLDQLSGGRIEVGLGAGGGFRPFEAFGIEREGFVARFTEGLRVMQAAWTQERFDLDGRFFRGHGLAVQPKPVQSPYPPIWFGGSHPDALRRAVRLADGFMGAGSTPIPAFLRQAATVRAELDRSGRDPAGFRIGKRIYLAVDDDPDMARREVCSGLHTMYDYFGGLDVEPMAVFGTPQLVAEQVAAVVAGGADVVVLHPLHGGAPGRDREQLERLAAEVVPVAAG